MSVFKKILIIFSYLLAFAFGFLIDRIIKDLPYLQLNPNVGVLDIASLLVSVLIAFLIPFCVAKLIEDIRGIKGMLVEELKDLVKIVSRVKQVIVDSHSKGKFTARDRDEINYIFHEAELKIGSIRDQGIEAFGNKFKVVGEILINILYDYKGFITGGELMISSFKKVNEQFYRESNTQYSKIETGLKTLIQKVYKF